MKLKHHFSINNNDNDSLSQYQVVWIDFYGPTKTKTLELYSVLSHWSVSYLSSCVYSVVVFFFVVSQTQLFKVNTTVQDQVNVHPNLSLWFVSPQITTTLSRTSLTTSLFALLVPPLPPHRSTQVGDQKKRIKSYLLFIYFVLGNEKKWPLYLYNGNLEMSGS